MIDVQLTTTAPRARIDVLAVCIANTGLLVDSAAVVPGLSEPTLELLQTYLAEADDPDDIAEAGTITELTRPGEQPRRILLVGVEDTSARSTRLAGAALARQAAATTVHAVVAGLESSAIAAFAEGLQLAAYRFGAAPESSPTLTKAVLLPASAGSGFVTTPAGALGDDLARAAAYARSCLWARDLTNTRTNIKSPAWLGEQATKALTGLGVTVTVHDETWLEAQGFGGVLGVGQGSQSPPRFIEASWRPRGATRAPHLVLVGKGITFDTGGYNLKPGASMTTMFTDMAGGAAVLAALRTVAELRLPVRVTALVPAAENSVSGRAMRPGDVLRHYNGRTSEITNTDAEGRLVLADALAYAVAKLRPTALIDIATLTGAMKMALGDRIAGLITDDDDLAKGLAEAAENVDEPLWRMPLNRDYEAQLDSAVADANNSPGAPGGITAALFLRHFVGDVPWAHIDIAGPARAAEPVGYFSEGATGFGARLLARWVESQLV